jgi:adenine-specific DNA-methyltransferase
MATGTPKAGHLVDPESVRLVFPGKRSERQILGGPVAVVHRAFSTSDAATNRVYLGENARVLRLLLADPAVCGHVRLVYIDPPFASQAIYRSRKQDHAYDDTLRGADYLAFLHERLVLLRELLAEDGSIYLHLDDKMVFHAKLLVDEVFGAKHFRNCIVRKKCNPKNYTRRTYGNVADYILFYSKSDDYIWHRQYEAWTDGRAREYRYTDDDGRRYMKVPVHAPGTRNGETGSLWRGLAPPPGKHWQFPPATLDAMDARGEIFWSSSGNPRRKVYFDKSPGVPVQDLWLDVRDAHNQNIKITGYPTEKNPDILHRIICASSDPGDMVLDAFAGSGTTLAAASELGRRFIGIDSAGEALRTMLHRFAHGTERMGDFVKRRNPSARKQVALFESDDDANGTRTEFTVSLEAGREHEAAAVLAEWRAPNDPPGRRAASQR